MSQGKGGKAATVKCKEEAPATPQPAPEAPPQPRDATRAEKEEIVYLNLSELFPFKDHPFGVRDDAEMKGLVESVKDNGVHQPALVRPREGGGYEIIAGHRRQRASELAGFANMAATRKTRRLPRSIAGGFTMWVLPLSARPCFCPFSSMTRFSSSTRAASTSGATWSGAPGCWWCAGIPSPSP